jgi:uncharacterized DUF497 family protein
MNPTKVVTWDPKKNETILKKHGVWFEEAATVLFDTMSLSNLNKHPSGERFEYLGHSDRSKLLYVVTVEKDDNEIRIISARKATSNEREQYEERI